MAKKITISLVYVVLLIVSALLMVAVVRAEDTTETNTGSSKKTESFTERKEKQVEEHKLEAEKKREEIKEQARLKVEEAKKEADAKKTEVRQKTCEARAEALKNKIESTSSSAIRNQEKIDDFNQKIDGFVKKYSLNVANYESLTASVAEKAAQSQQAIASLKTFPSNVDCGNVDAATASVIAYKSLVTSARDSLKDYRSATKDLLVAVKSTAEAAQGDDRTPATEANQ